MPSATLTPPAELYRHIIDEVRDLHLEGVIDDDKFDLSIYEFHFQIRLWARNLRAQQNSVFELGREPHLLAKLEEMADDVETSYAAHAQDIRVRLVRELEPMLEVLRSFRSGQWSLFMPVTQRVPPSPTTYRALVADMLSSRVRDLYPLRVQLEHLMYMEERGIEMSDDEEEEEEEALFPPLPRTNGHTNGAGALRLSLVGLTRRVASMTDSSETSSSSEGLPGPGRAPARSPPNGRSSNGYENQD